MSTIVMLTNYSWAISISWTISSPFFSMATLFYASHNRTDEEGEEDEDQN